MTLQNVEGNFLKNSFLSKTRTSTLKWISRRSAFKTKIGRNEIIFMILILSLIVGIVVGIAQCIAIDEAQNTKLAAYINNFFHSISSANINRYEVFFECMIKYGKFFLIIWILAFLPLSFIISVILIFVKGMSFSFTTAFLLKEFGIANGLYYFAFYALQNLIIIPLYIFVAFAGISFIVSQIKAAKLEKANGFIFSKRHIKIGFKDLLFVPVMLEGRAFTDYLIVFFVGVFCVVSVSLIEAFIIPMMF